MNRKYVLALGMLIAFALVFSQDRLIPPFLEITDYYHLSEQEGKNSYIIYFFGAFISSISSFYLLQKLSSKYNLLIGLSTALLGCLLVTFIDNSHAFMISRALEGFGIQLSANTIPPMITVVFNGKNPTYFLKRFCYSFTSAQVFSLFSCSMSVSGVIIPAVAGFLSQALGWKSLYSIFIGILGLLFIVVYKASLEEVDPYLQQEKSIPFKEKLAHLLHRKYFLGYCAVSFLCTILIIYQIISFSIVFLEDLDFTPGNFGLLSLVLGATSIISVTVTLKFAKKYEEVLRKLSICCAPFFSVVLVAWNFNGLHLLSYVIPLTFSMLCFGLFSPLLTAKTFASYQDNPKLASSFYYITQMIGSVIGSTLSSMINTQNYTNVFLCSLILTLSISLSYLWISYNDGKTI